MFEKLRWNLSFEDWLYRKADENAHNEILAFLMMILGMNLLIGGLLLTVMQVGELSISTLLNPLLRGNSFHIGFILTATGFFVISVAFILAVYYDKEKSWFVQELAKSTNFRKKALKRVPE